jgi:hypothetical protein
MKIIYFTILVNLIFSACNAQKGKMDSAMQDMNNAFFLESSPKKIILSDSLMNLNLSGHALIYVLLNKEGEVLDFQINKLLIKNTMDIILVDYLQLQNPDQPFKKFKEYPKDVQLFYNSIKEYVNSLRFKRNENVKLSHKPIYQIRGEI